MAASVHPSHDRRGLAGHLLAPLGTRATAVGLQHGLAPIRPTWKHPYPQGSMSQYSAWVRDDGMSIDPSVRTHQRLGARIVRVASNSMIISASVAITGALKRQPGQAVGQWHRHNPRTVEELIERLVRADSD